MENWKEDLKEYFGEHCVFNAPMSSYTTYRAGGAAEAFVLPKSDEDWSFLARLAELEKVPFRVLGAGSNILVSDGGLDGITASTQRMDELSVSGDTVKAGGGLLLDKVVEAAANAGLGGIEKLSGIPGTVGGAVYMNAGAFGQETFDALEYFEVMDADGHDYIIQKSDVKYAYRKVEGLEDLIILSAGFKLVKKDAAELLETRKNILSKRVASQPLEYPSAGSVFKRPEGDFASRLIDAAGLRGLSVGGAKVSEKHAGFIVNFNNATSGDIYKLMGEVQKRVKEKFGRDLELEQILWGKF